MNADDQKMTTLLEALAQGWSWQVGKPEAIVATNCFGDVIVLNARGHYFLIKPEEQQCELLAVSAAELEEKRNRAEFVRNWEMKELKVRAETSQGPLTEGQVYRRTKKKFRKTDLGSLLSHSGAMAVQFEEYRKSVTPNPKFVFGLIKKHKRAAALAYMLPVAGVIIGSVIYRPNWIDLITLVLAAAWLYGLVPDFALGVTRSNWGAYSRLTQPVGFWLSVSVWIASYILIAVFPIAFALQEITRGR